MSSAREGPDQRIAVLKDALRRLGLEPEDIRDELRRQNIELDPALDLALTETGHLVAALVAAYLPRPNLGVTGSLERVERALTELWPAIQAPDPAERTFRDRVLLGAVGRFWMVYDAAAKAAEAAYPGTPPIPELRRAIASAAGRRQVQAFLGELDKFQTLVNEVAREQDTAPAFVQQGELVTFYVRGMTLEINTARLHLRVNKTRLDLGALVSGIVKIRDVTDRFHDNVHDWTGRVTKNLLTGTVTLKDGLRGLMTGLKALGGMIDTDLPEAAWADDTGRDNFGPWASFTVKPKDGGPVVTQRLRWIPPGAFRMGSPPDEEGHRNNEFQGPEIVFAQGFWLFDTPCAQALWMAVMGPENNPSRFEGNPDRPVEMVSFRDVDRFIRAVNGLKPGLDLSLPSEAQWEYACRAGTTDAIYAGPATIGGKANVDVLNRIAWWSGNSGRETHPVGEKEPNLWGLHDMLGNVWEWCADAYHTGHRGAPRDGTVGGTADNAAGRVVRGGSSGGSARSVRAASRGGGAPSARGDNLGFRCARGPLK